MELLGDAATQYRPVPRAGNDRNDALRVEFGCLKGMHRKHEA